MLTPYPSQQACIAQMVESLQCNNVVLNTSQCGCGKTLMAIETCKQLGKIPIIVTPATVVTSWERSLEEQGCDYYDVLSWEKIKQGKTKWYKAPLKSRQLVYGTWATPKNAILIFDEAHKAKGFRTQNNILLLSAIRQGLPLILLTATPGVSPIDLSGIAYATRMLRDPRSFWLWCRQNGCTDCFFGGLEFKPKNRHYLEAINKKLRDKGVLASVPPEAIASHFPDGQVIPLYINVDAKIARSIKKMTPYLQRMEEAWEESMERAEAKEEEMSGAVELVRLRQQTELHKLPCIVEKTTELLESGRHVVIFLSFIESMTALADLLKVPCALVSGKHTKREVQEAIDRFQKDELPVILVQNQLGVGISLHDTHGTHPRASIVNLNFDIICALQCLGRVHRLGTKTNTLQYILTASNTVEEKIAKSIIDKHANLGMIIKQ